MYLISSLIKRSLSLQHVNTSYFSIKQQNTYAQKVMQMISDMSVQKTPIIQKSHIYNIAKNLKYVDQTKKQSMLKYFLAAMYSRSIRIQFLKSEQLQITLKYFPVIKIQLNIHIINQLKKQKNNKDNSNEINDKFLQCFKQILPNIKNQDQVLKAKSLLYKNFGKYLLQQNQLKKSSYYFENSIYQHKKLILNYSKKLQQIMNEKVQDKLNKQQKKQTQNQKQLRLNAMKQNIRKLIQSMFQVMITYYNSKKNNSQNATPNQKQQIIFETLALIKECFQVKQIIPGILHFSMYYHKLKKIQLELQFILAIQNKEKKALTKILKQMNDFCNDSLDDLKKAKQYPSILKEISIAIISIRLHLIKLQNKKNLKDQLVLCSQQIINILQANNKKIILKLLGEFIKKQIKN